MLFACEHMSVLEARMDIFQNELKSAVAESGEEK